MPVRNFCVVEAAAGYTSLAAEICLIANDGLKLPDPDAEGGFNLVWFNFSDYKNPSDDPMREIVKVTAKINDTLTIQRAQEGTVASNKNTAGKTYKLILALTKEGYDSIVPGWHGNISARNDGNIEPSDMGDNGVDFQFRRASADQTARGTGSFIAGGGSNKASGQESFCANVGNTASGTGSSAFGYENIASGTYSHCSGRKCTASGYASSASGYGAIARFQGQSAKANFYFNAAGDCQVSNIILRKVTEDDIPAVLSLDHTSGLSGKIILEDNTTYLFKGIILGRSANNLSVAYKIEGMIQRGLGAASTEISGNVSVTRIQDNSLSCDVNAEADTVNGALSIVVTGQPGFTIKWACSLDLLEIKN